MQKSVWEDSKSCWSATKIPEWETTTIRVEWRVSDMTLTQETTACVSFKAKNHQPFPKNNHTDTWGRPTTLDNHREHLRASVALVFVLKPAAMALFFLFSVLFSPSNVSLSSTSPSHRLSRCCVADLPHSVQFLFLLAIAFHLLISEIKGAGRGNK